MDNSKKSIRINCFNCRGLRNSNKRANIFTWLKQNYHGITFLQETHSAQTDSNKWQQEWGGKIDFSHGEFNSRGVAILIPKQLEEICDVKTIKTDDEGRFIIIECSIENNNLVLINLYCPTKDHISAQNNFLEKIKNEVENKSDKNLIIAGDLNTYLDITLDKKGDKIESLSSFSVKLNELCEEYMLHDIWRVRNPNSKTFTRRQKCKNGLVQSRLDYFLVSIGISYLIKKLKSNQVTVPTTASSLLL